MGSDGGVGLLSESDDGGAASVKEIGDGDGSGTEGEDSDHEKGEAVNEGLKEETVSNSSSASSSSRSSCTAT